MAYPTEVKVFIDGVDATKWLFGADAVELTNVENTFRKMDISSFIRGKGMHNLEITCVSGIGRVEARLEIG